MTRKSSKQKDIADRLTEALACHDTASFTAELMELVRERGLAKMALRTGVSRHTLYRYEGGERPPPLETALKIVSACGYRLTLVSDDMPSKTNEALELGDSSTFTSALMEIIKKRGMTSMAKKIGVSRHTLYRYEWNTDRPLLATALKMITASGFRLMVISQQDVPAPRSARETKD
jgi:probable addiction module antidote protein